MGFRVAIVLHAISLLFLYNEVWKFIIILPHGPTNADSSLNIRPALIYAKSYWLSGKIDSFDVRQISLFVVVPFQRWTQHRNHSRCKNARQNDVEKICQMSGGLTRKDWYDANDVTGGNGLHHFELITCSAEKWIFCWIPPTGIFSFTTVKSDFRQAAARTQTMKPPPPSVVIAQHNATSPCLEYCHTLSRPGAWRQRPTTRCQMQH